MTNLNSARGIRNHARFYTVGAVGLSVAAVVGFVSTVGATAAQAVVRPLTAGKSAVAGHHRVHHLAPRSSPARAPQRVTSATTQHVSTPVRSVGSTTYVAPATPPSPAPAAPRQVVVKPQPAPKPAPQPAPKPAPAPAPTPAPPPPAPTHSS